MSESNVVLLVWKDASRAYQAYSELKTSCDTVAAAVIKRNSDGTFDVRDGADKKLGLGTLGGTTIGTLLGVLGGPLGVILGFTGGLLMGGCVDARHEIEDDETLARFSRLIPPGHTGLVAEVVEASPDWIDAYAGDTGATVVRRSVEDVLDELSATVDAERAAEREVRRAIREGKRELRKAKRDELIATLRAKLKLS